MRYPRRYVALLVVVALALTLLAYALPAGAPPALPPPSQAVVAQVTDGPAPTPALPFRGSPTPAPIQVPTATPRSMPTRTPLPYEPTFEDTDCPFTIPLGHNVRCGYLTVPEDRIRPDGPTIRLAVAVFLSRSRRAAPDPVVYLEGGPGGSALRSYPDYVDEAFGHILEGRDLVLYDQRGVGYSQPALDCPEYDEAMWDVFDEDVPMAQEEERLDQALLRCRDRLTEDGVDLAAYNSAESAADLNDLRLVLGYEEWNLYGVSYGTRLALTEMRDFPEGIRSVVIDSVVPPQINLLSETPDNAAQAMNLLFEACAEDPSCSAAYPDLGGVFFGLVARLDEDPASIPLTRSSGETVDGLLTGARLVEGLFQALYATSLLPHLPKIVYEVRDGEYDMLAYLISYYQESCEDMSRGMQISVQCAEEVPFDSPGAVAAAIAAHPEFGDAFGEAESPFRLCQAWGSGPPAAIENEAVASDIPTLILAGHYDPVTPPAWGELAARTLPNSFYFELPNAGHGASLTGDCPRRIVQDFLDDPDSAPDAACVQRDMARIVFVVPVAAMEVTLVPFEDEEMGIRGVVPEGWIESGLGVYARSDVEMDLTSILQQLWPGTTVDEVLAIFRETFEEIDLGGLDFAGSHQAGGLDWSLYYDRSALLAMDVALVQTRHGTFAVVLLSLPEERDALYEAVFLPALGALEVGALP